MPSKLRGVYTDFDGERSTIAAEGITITAANLDAQEALMDAIISAITGVTSGVLRSTQKVFSDVDLSEALASSEWAQRETKWLLTLYDATANKRFKRELPCADLTLLDETETDPALRKSLPLAGGAGLALVTAYEAFMISPWGNAVVVESVVHVGRNT